MRKHILFDLDGTLTDPMEGITKSVQYALGRFNIEVTDRRELIPFIGPPLTDSFEKYYGFSHEEAVRAVWYYREYFAPTGIFENDVIPGIEETLKGLKEDGFSLYVATSKPEVFAEKIIGHFGMQQYFTGVAGSKLDGKRVRKEDVIRYICGGYKIAPEETVMVGDRHHDVEGAAACGIPCIGVLFGYGSREELTEAGACALAEDPAELGELLRQEI